MGEVRVVVRGQELGCMVVAEMTEVRADALFERVGVRAVFEHHLVVVSLDNEVVGFGDVLCRFLTDIAEVSCEDEFLAVVGESEAYAVGGVVRYGESLDVEVLDRNVLAFFVEMAAVVDFLSDAVVAVDAVAHLLGHVNWDMEHFAEDSDRFDVVCMVVSDEEAPDIAEFYVVEFEFPLDGAHRDSGIDEEAVLARAEVVTVAAATAAHAEEN